MCWCCGWQYMSNPHRWFDLTSFIGGQTLPYGRSAALIPASLEPLDDVFMWQKLVGFLENNLYFCQFQNHETLVSTPVNVETFIQTSKYSAHWGHHLSPQLKWMDGMFRDPNFRRYKEKKNDRSLHFLRFLRATYSNIKVILNILMSCCTTQVSSGFDWSPGVYSVKRFHLINQAFFSQSD